MLKKHPLTRKILLITALCLPIVFLVLWENNSGLSAKPQDTFKHLEEFANVLSIIKKNYVEEVDPAEAIQGAIRGMLATLDPHSSYMRPDDFKELQIETKGSFGGIGIEITMRDHILTVVSPIEGTPAFRQGLKAGDKIIKIEDEYTKDMTLMEAVKRLRGLKGTKVTISIHRRGWTELKEITIIRDVIPLHSVKARMLEPGYLYVRISNFQAKTTKDFKEALNKFGQEEEIKGLILDLRNNSGGLLDQAVKVSDIFLDEGTVVSTRGRISKQNMVFNAQQDTDVHNFPIIVLVNEGSASASEIVAGALQDHQRALILGAQTFGKGSVQTIIPMRNGAGLRLTTARYYTPDGNSIQATGITPDIVIPTVMIARQPEIKEDQDKAPRFMRERDLERHITNGVEVETEKQQDQHEQKDEEASTEEAQKEREELKKDPQLHTALMLLKGVNVFERLTR